MKNLTIKILALLLIVFSFGFFQVNTVYAQNDNQSGGLCGLLPCNVASPCLGASCGTNSLTVVGSILNFVLSLIFVGIIIYGIFLIVQAALKIVRSEGDESKIQEGTKLIRGAYVGLAMIFVGIIGLVIVFAIFNATDIFKVNPEDAPPGLTIT